MKSLTNFQRRIIVNKIKSTPTFQTHISMWDDMQLQKTLKTLGKSTWSQRGVFLSFHGRQRRWNRMYMNTTTTIMIIILETATSKVSPNNICHRLSGSFDCKWKKGLLYLFCRVEGQVSNFRQHVIEAKRQNYL